MSVHSITDNKLLPSGERISLLKRQTNISKPRLSSSNSHPNSQLPIISLSKLKNYMPQNQSIEFDASSSVASSSLNAAPSAHSLRLPPVAYNGNSLKIANSSLCKLKHPSF